MLRVETYSHRYGKEILDTKSELIDDIYRIILNSELDQTKLSRPILNNIIKRGLNNQGWNIDKDIFFKDDSEKPDVRDYFIKNRVALIFSSKHSHFIGTDLLKFQIDSASYKNKIDLGIYIVTTKKFQETMEGKYGNKWRGSLYYDQVVNYLRYYNHIISIPIFVVGIDI